MPDHFPSPAPAAANMHRFPIGTQYMVRSGTLRMLCTVVDQLTTLNSKGEVHSLRYISEHTFCGHPVTDRDVVDTTIARGLTPEFAHLLHSGGA